MAARSSIQIPPATEMTFRTFLFLLLSFTALLVIVVLAQQNRELLAEPFHLFGGAQVPVYITIISGFLIGVGISLVGSLVRNTRALAEKWKQRKARKQQRSFQARFLSGVEKSLNHEEEHAARIFEALLQENPGHAPTHLELGNLLFVRGQHREAIAHHRKAHEIEPDNPRIVKALIRDYRQDGQLDAAIDLLRQVIAKRPKETRWAYREIRNQCIARERWDEALEWQESLERKTDASPEPNLRAGIRYERALRWAETDSLNRALRELQSIAEDVPHFVPAYYSRGKLLVENNDHAEAIDCWREGYRNTRAPVFLTALEDHFLEIEDPGMALDILREIASDEPENPLPAFFLGRLFYRLEMLDEALDQFQSLASQGFHSPALASIIADIHERHEEFEAAVRSYRAALDQLSPLALPFLCDACSAQASEWYARCPNCERWNTLVLDIGHEPSPEELGLHSAPVYGLGEPS